MVAAATIGEPVFRSILAGGFGRLGVDGEAGDLRESLADAVLEGGGDVVDGGDGEIALHGAMAGDEDLALDLADADFVAIDQLVKFALKTVDEGFDVAGEVAHFDDFLIAGGDVRAQ